MSSNLRNLDTLDLSDCEQVTDDGIEQVTFNCRMLRTLYVANCHKVGVINYMWVYVISYSSSTVTIDVAILSQCN